MILRRRRLPEEAKPDEGNMTPMIDIVFQLLIFFMLSMHFKEVEGKLMSQLPKGGVCGGLEAPPIPELRVILCANGDTLLHRTDKGRHIKAAMTAESTSVLVDAHELGQVHRTETKSDAAASNRAVYRAIAAKLKELYPFVPGDKEGRGAPVIIDADSEVPYEHIIGAVNACKEAGVDKIEFAANPKHEKYYR